MGRSRDGLVDYITQKHAVDLVEPLMRDGLTDEEIAKQVAFSRKSSSCFVVTSNNAFTNRGPLR